MTAPHMPQMNDEGLIECPFCGDSGVILDKCDGLHHVVCVECGIATDGYIKKSRIIEKWNTRNGHLWTKQDFKDAAWERQNSDIIDN